MKPATVNRELDTLRAILSWAVKEGKLVESPMAEVERLRVDNRRIRVLTPAEQLALLRACQSNFKLAVLVELLLITGAREGEFLALQWQDDHGSELHFIETKNGERAARTGHRDGCESCSTRCRRPRVYVFTNARTGTATTTCARRSGAPSSAPASPRAM